MQWITPAGTGSESASLDFSLAADTNGNAINLA